MAKRQGVITTIFIVLFCIFVGIGVIWFFLRQAVDETRDVMTNIYPSGVYHTNNVLAVDLLLYTIPFFAVISLIFFTYISIKRQPNQ